MKRAVLIILMWVCAAQSQTVDVVYDSARLRWTGGPTNWLASFGFEQTESPLAAYSRSVDIVGFWHSKHSGGLNVQLGNTSSVSNRWVDLSGYGNDIMLSSFAMTTNSGWKATGELAFDGAMGTATGTVANVASNISVMVVARCLTTGGLRMIFESSANLNNFAGSVYLDANENSSGSIAGVFRCSPSYSTEYTATGVITSGVPFCATATVNGDDTSRRMLEGFSCNTAMTLSSFDSRYKTGIYNGIFYLGSRAGSSYRMAGDVALVAIWKATLTPAEVSNNVAVARQQFGF